MASAGPPRGRALLLALRVAAVALSLLFAGLLVTTVLMVTPGTLEFVPPEESTFRFQDGVIYIDTSFVLGNGGYHDLTDLTFFVRGEVEGAGLVTDYRTPPVDVVVGERKTVDLSIPLPLAPFAATGALVFFPADVTFTMGLEGTTTRSLLDFAGSYTFRETFEPLVSVVDLDFDGSNLTFDGTDWAWSVPYVVGTAPFLPGSATVDVRVFNETGSLLTETEEVFPLGGTAEGNLTFLLGEDEANELQTTSQTLTVQVELELPGGLTFALEVPVPWTPEEGP